MPLQIVRNDITKMKVDAIVNAANSSLLGGGGVDGAIHRAAGPKLLEECRGLNGCRTGEAKITGAYKLHARYVIHTVGPVWEGGGYHEKELLTSCYQKSLALAAENHCESVAFPLISSGIYGYPKAEALQVAVSTIGAFLLEHDMTVYLVIFDRAAVQLSEKLFSDIQEYIDDHYVDEHRDTRRRLFRKKEATPQEPWTYNMAAPMAGRPTAPMPSQQAAPMPSEQTAPNPDEFCQDITLEEMLQHVDESFSQMLLRKIEEAGMKDSECYKRANIDRKLFSKIRSDVHYKPKKQTAIAFAIALKLSYKETEEMLMKAGYALSRSNKFDIIIEYFIRHGKYNIFEINEALFAFDQSLLGG